MTNKGKHTAQTMEEMITTMNENKQQELSPGRGRSVYKAESGEYQENKLRELLSLTTEDMADITPGVKVSLEDIEEIKRRTICYLRACEETATFPSLDGLAHSLGYSRRALNYWRDKKPESPTGQWLEIFSEKCSEVLSQSALKNNANNIYAIFINKAKYGLRETNELVVTPNRAEDDTPSRSIEEIKALYSGSSSIIDPENITNKED